MEPLQWVFVVTALTLVFVVFAINPLQVAINQAIQSDVELQAQRLASTINIVRTSPDGTVYTFDMPNSKCLVTITDSFVKLTVIPVTGLDISQTISLIKTDTPINGGTFECKGNRQVEMKKTNGILGITFR